MTIDPHPEQLSEEQLVALAERALAILHTRYSDEQTLVARLGTAAADDVRLALENALRGASTASSTTTAKRTRARIGVTARAKRTALGRR